jgi:hypothetical protein
MQEPVLSFLAWTDHIGERFDFECHERILCTTNDSRLVQSILARLLGLGRNTEIRMELPMTLKEWDTIIQQIVNESNQEPKEAGKRRLLMKWREKLEKEPPHLRLHQIDEIVREVRRRVETSNG